MLEKILLEICQEMSEFIDQEQIEKLKNILFIAFHDKTIMDDKKEIIPAEPDEDMRLIQIFVASKMVAGRGKRSLEQYVREIKVCKDTIGKSLKEINTMDLRWYLGLMQERRKNKPTTLQNKIRYLNSFYTFLVKEGILSVNPVSRIETPKRPQTIKKPFSAEDMEAMRKCCTHPRDRALIEFLYSTGLRVSELTSLNVSDIDFSRQEFNVIGKGSKERIVYFSAAAGFHLKNYLYWKEENIKITDEALFVGAHGKRMKKGSIEVFCRNLGKRAGVENVHPHRFRRTFATNMAARGMKLEELMKLMGHSKMDTTLIYCTIGQENVKSAYKKCA